MTSPGTLCTAILHTRDAAGSARFYSTIFGWSLKGDRFMLRDQCAAAVTAASLDPDRWVPCFSADNVADGAISLHVDPDGAVFGTCAAGDPREVTLTQGPGSIWWVEELTHKVAETKRFYSDMFQWTYVERAPFKPHPMYIFCMQGDKAVTGILPIGPGWEHAARWQVLFEVEDLAASSARVLAAGGTHYFGPLDVPSSGVLNSFHDPRGAFFFLVQPHKRS